MVDGSTLGSCRQQSGSLHLHGSRGACWELVTMADVGSGMGEQCWHRHHLPMVVLDASNDVLVGGGGAHRDGKCWGTAGDKLVKYEEVHHCGDTKILY